MLVMIYVNSQEYKGLHLLSPVNIRVEAQPVN